MGSSCNNPRDLLPSENSSPLENGARSRPDSSPSVVQGVIKTGEAVEGRDHLPKVAKREPNHIFDITFRERPLGIILTSAESGLGAYLTKINETKSKTFIEQLPKNSKLLRVNDIEIEEKDIEMITDLVVREAKKLPLKLTFCHPDGLDESEIPDPNPQIRCSK